MAGTAAALDNGIGVVGVAPGARLWAVKVLFNNGSGYFSDVIEGIDYVTAHANEIEVANMSLGGTGKLDSLRTAIQNSVAAGVVYVVAAGNDSLDVYGIDGTFNTNDDSIPASYPEVAAISAMGDTDGQSGGLGPDTSYGTPDDTFASFTNFSNSVVAGNPVTSPGAAIDLAAPGVDIVSTSRDGYYATMSGTSMASPHVAGATALEAATNGRATNAAGVAAIRQALIDGAQSQSAWGPASTNEPDTNLEGLVLVASSPPDTTPPAAPSGLTATGGDGSVDLDWADNTEPDLASYNMKRSTTAGGPYTQIASDLTTSAYTDSTVTNGTTYYYVVTAVDTSSNESAISNEASATPVDTTPPAAPTGLTATGSDGSVGLDWADNTEPDLASYNVKRSTTAGGPYTQIASGLTTSAYTDSTVTNGTTYYYVVTAVDTASNESANSNEASATPQAGGILTVEVIRHFPYQPADAQRAYHP